MPSIPIVSSILSTIHLQSHLQGQYHFQNPIQLKLLKTGINHSYLLRDGSTKYVFRIYTYSWRSKNEIAAELNLLEKLKSNDLSVSYPIKTKKSEYILELSAPEGLRFGVLFSFAKGKKQMTISEDVHEKVGISMARFHKFTEGDTIDRITYNSKNIILDSLPKLESFLSKDSEQFQWMKEKQGELLSFWKSADESQIRQGTVHLDMWPDNFHIDEENELTFFDFDFCGNGWQCLDLAYYLLQLHSLEKDEKIRKPKVEAFLAGYESIQAITPEERCLLPMMGVSLYYFYLGIQCDHFENWSNVFLNESYLQRYIDLLVKGYYSNHF